MWLRFFVGLCNRVLVLYDCVTGGGGIGIDIDKHVGSVTLTRMLSGRCHIDFCNCLIHSGLLNSVWISGQKIGGNPRLK